MNNQSTRFKKIQVEISEITGKSEVEFDSQHSKNTVKWIRRLEKNPSKELLIAALAHDIERGLPPSVLKRPDETYDNYKMRHAQRSSEIIANLMLKFNFTHNSIEKVRKLVKNHEVGGDKETNILRDADSVAFFDSLDSNVKRYIKKGGFGSTKDRIKDKIIFMYQRTSSRAKRLIKSLDFENKELRIICSDISERC